MTRPVIGVVLAGGKSRRMGHDKARIVFRGAQMLTRTADLLGALVDEVVVAGRDPEPHGLALPYLIDDIAGLGPAGGILTALRSLGGPILTVSCDLPFIDPATLTHLLAEASRVDGDQVMTTFYQVETGYIEALVSVYEPSALPVLEQAVERGERKLSAIFPPPLRRHIPYAQHEALPFFNINYPADLAAALALETDAHSPTAASEPATGPPAWTSSSMKS
jgi:molybdopterin-guanine dinucleotide biosynthesis protein A